MSLNVDAFKAALLQANAVNTGRDAETTVNNIAHFMAGVEMALAAPKFWEEIVESPDDEMHLTVRAYAEQKSAQIEETYYNLTKEN